MKLLAHFNQFLDDTVNLNTTRFAQLESSIEAIKNAVSTFEWPLRVLRFAAQGSWAHKTIIRPLPGNAFDADLLMFVKPVDGWEAKDYLAALSAQFRNHPVYADKVRRYSHCITIEYVGDRKIDIVPCVVERSYAKFEVCNGYANEFQRSEPDAYTAWLIQRNAIVGNNNFRKSTRLLKYLRDIKTTFTCPSFLLTTLMGMQVRDSDRGSSAFTDVPTTLRTLVGRLDDWLQSNPLLPTVYNPVLVSEIQSLAWDQVKYGNFRDKINRYRGWIDEAYAEEDATESLGKWRRIFGADFGIEEASARAGRVSEDASLRLSAPMPVAATGSGDLVDMVLRHGESALPPGFTQLPHMRRSLWKIAGGTPIQPIVRAQYFPETQQSRPLRSLQPTQRGGSVRFEAVGSSGMPIANAFKVRWRITNTDKMAQSAKQLRGNFYPSEEGIHARSESLSYRGVHMVEAFVIHKFSNLLAGKSTPFYVVIE